MIYVVIFGVILIAGLLTMVIIDIRETPIESNL